MGEIIQLIAEINLEYHETKNKVFNRNYFEGLILPFAFHGRPFVWRLDEHGLIYIPNEYSIANGSGTKQPIFKTGQNSRFSK